ncbi:MAG: hypothetical protein LBD20_02455 [Spirochaetaceae bacterium]|nr:hypothetical protein [Spirochaetaceae bacterium]
MELSDWTTGINTAMEKGIQQGMDKGMETKSFDIARKALAENLPVGLIQKITGLRLEYIIALQARK